jgi:phage tail-like protein
MPESNGEKQDKVLGNYRFLIELDGKSAGFFKSMSGMGSKQDVIEYKMGGDKSVRRKAGRVTFNNIVLEKGFSTNGALYDWRKKVIDGSKDGKDDRKDGAIVILDHDGSEQVRYNFFRAWPVSWEAPALTAGAAESAIEKIELAVEWVERD